jgi:peptide/nickel transport system permease protein
MALFADVITLQSPNEQNIPNRLQPPVWMDGGSWDDPLGTDTLGRDMLVRLVHGARITLIVALTVLVLGGGLGLIMGVLAGYFGGWVDHVLMRITDSALAIPALFMALLLGVIMGPSFTTVIVAISLVIWAHFARILRAEVLRIREMDFVAQARVAGCSNTAIIIRHIVPNLLNTWVVLLSLQLGAVIIIEAMLSFLGAGVPPETPSWGGLVSDGRQFIATKWWLSFFPGLAITLVVLAFNMFGDWLRDTLDPKLRQVR